MDELNPGQLGEAGMPQIDWSQAEDLKCDECGSTYFRQAQIFKKVSKFMTGAERDTLFPFTVLRCDDCGHVNDSLKPQFPEN